MATQQFTQFPIPAAAAGLGSIPGLLQALAAKLPDTSTITINGTVLNVKDNPQINIPGLSDGNKSALTVAGNTWSYNDASIALGKLAALAGAGVIGQTAAGAATLLGFATVKTQLGLVAPDVAVTAIAVAGNRTLVATDANQNLIFSAVTFTLPSSAPYNFSGKVPSSGNLILQAGGGVTLTQNGAATAGSVTLSGGGWFSCMVTGTNSFDITSNAAGSAGVPPTRSLIVNGITRDLSADQRFPGGVRPIGQIFADSTKTDANATEATLATITMPAAAMEAGDDLIVHCRGTFNTTTATNKVFQVKLGGVSFFISSDTNASATGSFEFTARLFARSTSSQVGTQGYVWGSGGTNGNPGANLTRDLTASQDITVTAQFPTAGSGAQSITLRVAYADLRKGS